MHVDSVRRLLRQKKLPGVKVGGGWRIPRAALVRMLAGESFQPIGVMDPDKPSKGTNIVIQLPACQDRRKLDDEVIDVEKVDR